MRISIVLAAVLAGGLAAADTDPAIAQLEKALPAGWTLMATDNELVLRHDRPCYVTDDKASSAGPLITLELRYRLQPVWTTKQIADARATNDKIDAQLRELRKKLAIDAIKNGQTPTTAEHARLDTYAKGEAAAAGKRVKLPRCTLGRFSLFDDEAYRQLSLPIDPPSAVTEAHAVSALVVKACGG